ncbi:MAG: carbonic anhydrase [Verrucomicrobia bacterium]|nr:carbonic anhydrase [Verrucomicrobiota bacterium]
MKNLAFLITCYLSSLQAVLSGEAGLKELLEGNQRFATGKTIHSKHRESWQVDGSETSQTPFAVVLGCSDSRVSPEIIFDQNLGDLFIVRVAGNIAGPIEVASIEYAASQLNSSLILVLGHENCGAVTAVVEGKAKDIEPIASLIEPAVKKALKKSGDRIDNSIRENVMLTVSKLQKHPALKPLIDKQKLLIKGGYYDLHTGKVEILAIDIPK